VFVHASIGIAEGPGGTADELLRDADLALYEAKNVGKDRHVVFDLEMRSSTVLKPETDRRDEIE
jgi:predicted signal transduction protein with EAL and GGDEF domain